VLNRETFRKLLPAGWLPYLLHLRPRAWLIVAAHMSVGLFLANGFDFNLEAVRRWLLAILAWAILGNGGTLAINSVFDKDEGDIGYLENPPPAPRYLLQFSLSFLILGLLVASWLGTRFLIAYGICLVLSLAYSVPPIRAKARAGLDVLINSAGYGALTIYAGWAAMDQAFEPPIINIVLGFFFLFAGFYPLTQIYQMNEDRGRGDTTLALLLGKRRAILFAIASVGVAFIFMLGESFSRYLPVRSSGLVIALILWAVVLLPWYHRYGEVDEVYEQRGFYHALWVWAVTDIAIVLAMAPVS
jgi:4-hydroxybenzoate polyprenyltransferase